MKQKVQLSISRQGKSSISGTFFQPKLTINQPGDAYEQEADAMADRVMQNKQVPSQNAFFNPSASIQRKCAQCEGEEKLHRKEASGGNAQPSPQTESYISALTGKGNSLSHSEKSFFESSFGHNFSDVRIHTDAAANESAKSMNALAYTHGNNIVFGTGSRRRGCLSDRPLPKTVSMICGLLSIWL